MNIIDFHTHYYPDRIAAGTIETLEKRSGLKAPLESTRESLLRSMNACGITRSVVLPVATNPDKVHSINERNRLINGNDSVFFAGAIHPECSDIDKELDYIKDAGFFGIKIHPDYQNTFFDDPKYIRIMEGAALRDLIVVTHAGADPGFPDSPVRCTPDRICNVLNSLSGLIDDKLVLAHLGGTHMCAEVLDKLVGAPVWMDTAFVLDLYPEQCREIIRRHTPSRILFGTDFPWVIPSAYVKILQDMSFKPEELQQMLWENGNRLLHHNQK